jgi:hypothetical protein
MIFLILQRRLRDIVPKNRNVEHSLTSKRDLLTLSDDDLASLTL